MGIINLISGLIESNKNLKKTREEILEIREKKFRKMLKFAYNNSKFYHELYKSNGITENDLDTIGIEKIPIIDKKILMDNFDDVVTKNDVKKDELLDYIIKNKDPYHVYKNRYNIIYSSGSSGNVGIFVYKKNDYDKLYSFITRAYKFKLKKIKSVFLGAADGHYSTVTFVIRGNRGIMKLFYESIILDINQPIENRIEEVNNFNPDVIAGYFSGLKILADYQQKGILNINPKKIVSSGEGVIPKDKKYIEEVFGKPLINIYGCVECSLIGIGKNEYDGVYIMDDLVYIEFKDDHILLTNLFNKTMPIIRYRIEDYIKVKEDKNKIMPFTLVDEIMGRKEFDIWLRNDYGKLDFISPLIIMDFYVKGLDKLQFVIQNEDYFIFRVVIKDKDKEKVKKEIKKRLNEILALKDFTKVKYDIEVVEDIPVDKKTGKFKFVAKK